MSQPRRDDLVLPAMPIPAAPPLSAAFEAELAALQPIAPRRPLRQLGVLVAVSAVYASGLLVALRVRPDAGELPIAYVVGAGLAWLLGFVVPSYLALVPRPGAVMPRWWLGALAATVASLGLVVLGLVVHPAGPSSGSYGWDQFGRGHGCLELGLATALVPVVLGALFLRGALPVGARGVAASLGAGGGALGGLVLHAHCRIADGPHLGLVHGGVVVLAALLAAAIVPRATMR